MTDSDLPLIRDQLRDCTGLMVAAACIWEATSRKPGNVHRFADFHDTSYLDFTFSALALAEVLTWTGPREQLYRFGSQVLQAVYTTKALVGRNTNLGIVLATLPLARANERKTPPSSLNMPLRGGVYDMRAGVRQILDRLSIQDAKEVYSAIRAASPGGLGDAPEQDVRTEPTVTLLEAMKLAADRDLIARQYANGFADVFDFGVPAFLAAFERFGCVEAAIIDCQLRWLAEYPDSLIARKNSLAVAEDVRRRATEVMQLGGIATPEGRAAGVALDKHLRSDGNKLNPGTTADLITACLFVALREGKVQPSAPFRWQVEDWL